MSSVITYDDARARVAREGQVRAAYTLCMTCVERSQSYRSSYAKEWHSWEAATLSFLARDLTGHQTDLANRELHALAALAAAHQEEFVALLSAGNDLAERRAKKKGAR